MPTVRNCLGIVFLILLPALGGCKKDALNSKTELLTAHPWYLTAQKWVVTSSSGKYEEEQFSRMPICAKDNSLNFQAQHQVTFNPNAWHCGINEVPVAGTWAFTDNGTHLMLPDVAGSGASPVYEYEVNGVTESSLYLARTIAGGSGSSETTYYTYSATSNASLTALEQNTFNLLTAHKWRLSKLVTNSFGVGAPTITTDEYAKMPACRCDDFLQFNSDYTVVNDEGASRCKPTDPQNNSTAWFLIDFGRSFNFKDNILGYPTLIGSVNSYIVLTDTRLSIVWDSHSMGGGSTVHAEYTAL